MKFDKSSLLLYAVTDRTWLRSKSLAEQVEQAIQAGVTFVQLREKNLSFDEYVKLGKEIKTVTDRYHIPFVIDDDIEVALACHADGIHVGQSDTAALEARAKIGNDKILGISAQTVEQAIEAEQNGADYLGVGAIFSTSTKLDANSVSFDTLKMICAAVSIPVVAIGGINRKNILSLSGSGIAGVSVVSALFAQSDIKAAASELYLLSKKIVV